VGLPLALIASLDWVLCCAVHLITRISKYASVWSEFSAHTTGEENSFHIGLPKAGVE